MHLCRQMEQCPIQELDKHAFMQVNGAMSNSGVGHACIYAGEWRHVQPQSQTKNAFMQINDAITQELDKHAFMQVNGAMSNSGVRQPCIYAGKWSHVQLRS